MCILLYIKVFFLQMLACLSLHHLAGKPHKACPNITNNAQKLITQALLSNHATFHVQLRLPSVLQFKKRLSEICCCDRQGLESLPKTPIIRCCSLHLLPSACPRAFCSATPYPWDLLWGRCPPEDSAGGPRLAACSTTSRYQIGQG